MYGVGFDVFGVGMPTRPRCVEPVGRGQNAP